MRQGRWSMNWLTGQPTSDHRSSLAFPCFTPSTRLRDRSFRGWGQRPEDKHSGRCCVVAANQLPSQQRQSAASGSGLPVCSAKSTIGSPSTIMPVSSWPRSGVTFSRHVPALEPAATTYWPYMAGPPERGRAWRSKVRKTVSSNRRRECPDRRGVFQRCGSWWRCSYVLEGVWKGGRLGVRFRR